MNSLDLVPVPREVLRRAGTFALKHSTRIAADGPAADTALLLQELLRPGTGIPLPVVPAAARAEGDIVLILTPDDAGEPEAYTLDITPERVEIRAPSTAGLGWGVQTLRQLLPAESFRSTPVAPPPLTLACVRVEDAPRFPWRGLMLDVARHFMPKDFVLRLIDLAALHRLNVFHLHLTDDQGWRLEVPSWPGLTSAGAWRRETPLGPVDAPTGHDGTPHGGFYTLAELREMAAYAARRHITLVPEFGFPGHTQAALGAYPELGQAGPVEVRTRWGHSPHVLAPNPEALRFISDVLDVVVDTFPSPYVHIGGDECRRDEWRTSGYAKARAAELGLASVDALQSWFLRYGIDRLSAAGRRAVGWDQVLEDGGVPESTVVMAWRDFAADTASEALAAGHDVIQCPTRTTYLDHAQSELTSEPPSFYGVATFDDVAAYDPDPGPDSAPDSGPNPASDSDGGAVERRGRILGTQGHLWTEYMRNPRDVEYMAFPRLAAIAEAAWSGRDRRLSSPLAGRMGGYLERLDAIGINYRPWDGPHPWQRSR
ncbi:beta-N-acetylhexosaminidase [Streptomyces sp. NPDC056909]|uniref:beta-N-acetylhexosaminidase n=1 Tax=Streptomyces sp. NPDC056909 TaxID=3345963 RepID=UPI0036A08CC4